jgi:hypothetical protein
MTTTATTFSVSIFDREIDLSTKEGIRLFEIGTEPLPTPFSGHGKDLRLFINALHNRAKKCKWVGPGSIMEFDVNGQKLDLLKDYGRIPIDIIKKVRDDRNARTPTSVAETRSTIDSTMMFECIEKSLDPRVANKLLKQALSIDRDGPTIFKQIIENTFVTTTPTTFATKTELFSLHLKDSKYNIVVFHEDVREKVTSLEAVGHSTADIDLIVSLFMAYDTSDNDIFKLDVRMLKNAYDRGDLVTSDELMEATEAKYDELVKTNKWEAAKPKEDPNLIALTATVKTLTDALQAKKSSDNRSGNSNPNRQRGSAAGSWKYDPSLGSDGTYTRKVDGKDPKIYKWCTGPGHGGKPMWVCGHEPGSCDENYDRNSSRSIRLSRRRWQGRHN